MSIGIPNQVSCNLANLNGPSPPHKQSITSYDGPIPAGDTSSNVLNLGGLRVALDLSEPRHPSGPVSERHFDWKHFICGCHHCHHSIR